MFRIDDGLSMAQSMLQRNAAPAHPMV